MNTTPFKTHAVLAGLAVIGVFVVWIGALWCAGFVASAVRERTAFSEKTTAQSNSLMQVVRNHTIATALSTSSVQLETLVHSDIFSIAQQINQLGTSTHSTVKIQLVKPAGIYTADPSLQPPQDLHAIVFSVGIEGSFTSVMRTLSLLEVLPLPSEVDGVALAPINGNSGTSGTSSRDAVQWHMDVNVTVLTTAQISS